MAEFFHVLIALREGAERLLLVDLSRSDLQKLFLKSYRRGKKFTVASEIVDPHELASVRIIKTDVIKKSAMNRLIDKGFAAAEGINADTHGSGVFVMPPLYGKDTDIKQAGEDVTATFMTGPPGSGKSFFYYLNHPWTITIIGGLIVTVMALIFG